MTLGDVPVRSFLAQEAADRRADGGPQGDSGVDAGPVTPPPDPFDVVSGGANVEYKIYFETTGTFPVTTRPPLGTIGLSQRGARRHCEHARSAIARTIRLAVERTSC